MLPIMKKYMPGDELLVRHISTQNIRVGHELLCKTQDTLRSDKFLHHRDERHTCCLRNMHEEYKGKGTPIVSRLELPITCICHFRNPQSASINLGCTPHAAAKSPQR